jgi:hypothetical protein
MDLLLTGRGYKGEAHLASEGYANRVEFQIPPPRHSLIGNACIINRGRTSLPLEGTSAPNASRSALTINGKRVAGNLTLIFLEDLPKTRVRHLGTAFEHISNLTDRLVPVWLVWVFMISLLLGVPVAIVAAVYRAVRDDEGAARA